MGYVKYENFTQFVLEFLLNFLKLAKYLGFYLQFIDCIDSPLVNESRTKFETEVCKSREANEIGTCTYHREEKPLAGTILSACTHNTVSK